jgi:hypothetical protein
MLSPVIPRSRRHTSSSRESVTKITVIWMMRGDASPELTRTVEWVGAGLFASVLLLFFIYFEYELPRPLLLTSLLIAKFDYLPQNIVAEHACQLRQ